MIFFSLREITGRGSASLKLCVSNAASPWSQCPSPDSQWVGDGFAPLGPPLLPWENRMGRGHSHTHIHTQTLFLSLFNLKEPI